MQRREFIKATGIWLLANDSMAASGSRRRDRGRVIGSAYFGALVYTLFPVDDPTLLSVYGETIERLHSVRETDWVTLNTLYESFRAAAEHAAGGDPSRLTLDKTEAIVSGLLERPSTADGANDALDVLYKIVGRAEGFGEAIWQRTYSVPGNMCAFWFDYDKPVG